MDSQFHLIRYLALIDSPAFKIYAVKESKEDLAIAELNELVKKDTGIYKINVLERVGATEEFAPILEYRKSYKGDKNRWTKDDGHGAWSPYWSEYKELPYPRLVSYIGDKENPEWEIKITDTIVYKPK